MQPKLILEPRLRLAYLPIPKAASTSIKEVLHKSLELPIVERAHVHQAEFPKADRKPRNYFLFTVVRNPLDRIVSAYSSKMVPTHIHDLGPAFRIGMTFEQFIRVLASLDLSKANGHVRPQVEFLRPHGRLDCVMKLERLKEHWWLTGLPFLRKINVAEKRAMHTSETEGIVRRLYAEDFKEFEY